jgi:carboxylesterase type B
MAAATTRLPLRYLQVKNESLPVLLWIHGGGYTEGNAANAGGPSFVSSSDGSMVFVSIQYRLGAYGFLSSEAVFEDGSPNAALLDQRAAIDWVHRHIGAFGGDPEKVCQANRSQAFQPVHY